MEATSEKNECVPVAPAKRASSKSPPNGQQEKYGKYNSDDKECTCEIKTHQTACGACLRQERWKRVLQKLRWVSRGLGSHKEASFLFPEHWLEAVDERHRVGSGLNHYFSNWLRSSTDEVIYV